MSKEELKKALKSDIEYMYSSALRCCGGLRYYNGEYASPDEKLLLKIISFFEHVTKESYWDEEGFNQEVVEDLVREVVNKHRENEKEEERNRLEYLKEIGVYDEWEDIIEPECDFIIC